MDDKTPPYFWLIFAMLFTKAIVLYIYAEIFMVCVLHGQTISQDFCV